MTRRILITGATGFVGRHVLRELLKEDVLVTVVARQPALQKLPKSPKIGPPCVTGDLFEEDESWWRKNLHGIEVVVHLAWYAEPGKYQLSPKNMDCLLGTLRMARAATAVGVKRLVGVGTCLEYAPSSRPLPTGAPLGPCSPYAACKAAAYLALAHLLPQAGTSFAWCRLFYLHGDGEDPRRLVPTLRKSLVKGDPVALTHGTQIRDFLDVQEAGRQLAEVSLGRQLGSLNVCSGKPITVRALAESIADEYGRRDLLKFGARPENPEDPPCMVGIPSKFKD